MLRNLHQQPKEVHMQTNEQRNKEKAAAKFVAPEEHRQLLAEVSGAIAAIGRHDTAQALDRGRQLARAKAVLPEKSFGKWVKQECGLTTRQAWNYIVPVERFSEQQQEQLITAAVKPTVMATLATAEAEKIAELLALIVAGEQFTVGQMKLRIKGNAPEKAPSEAGGTAGLLRAANAKLKAESEMFGKLVKIVLKAVEQAAADLHRGKHLAKTTLAEKVEIHSQKASALLRSVIEPVQAVAETPRDWEKARQIISRLGDSPRWPGRMDFPSWVTDQVLPALRFIVHGTPISGEGAVDIEVLVDSPVDDTDGEPTAADPAEDSASSGEAEIAATATPSARRIRLAAPPALVPDEPVLTPETPELGTAVSD